MTPPASRFSLRDYDAVLGPVIAAHRHSTPRVASLALAARAHTAGIPSGTLRLWASTQRTHDGVKALASSPASWRHHTAPARQHAAEVSTPPGRARLRLAAARRLVACLLSPLPAHVKMSTGRNVRARHALAVLGLEFLRRAEGDGFDTIVMGGHELSVHMGCTRRTASAALNACVDAGWLRRMPTRQGASPRWKLSRLPSWRGDVADANRDLIAALSEGSDQCPFVEVFSLAAHPAIGYGEDAEGDTARVGHFAWLLGLSDEAGVDPVGLGMTIRTLPRYRKAWLAAVAEGDTFQSGLDAWAHAHGSDFLRDAAADAYADHCVVRKAEIEEVRTRRTTMRDGLNALLDTHPVPQPSAPVEDRDTWVAQMTTAVAESDIPNEMRTDLTKALAGKMCARHYPDHVAAKVAAVIVPSPTERGAA